MKELAKSYIQKRIEQAQQPETNRHANTIVHFEGETMGTEVARQGAQEGNTALTARLVELAETLPVSQKGELLAEAYEKAAENTMEDVRQYNDPHMEAFHQKGVQRLERVSQGLRRAAKSSQNS